MHGQVSRELVSGVCDLSDCPLLGEGVLGMQKTGWLHHKRLA